MRLTKPEGLTEPSASMIEAAILKDTYDGPKGERSISVTQLVGPAQKRQLERAHEADLEMPLLDAVPMLFGSALHAVLERAGASLPDMVPEKRLSALHDGWEISGKPDLYVSKDAKLIDYKTGSVWSYIYGKPEWESQLNVYAWLCDRNGFPVRSLEILLFCLDWRRSEARKMGDYPPRIAVLPVRLWSTDERTAYVDRRLALHRQELPPCSPEERWAKADSWAIRKEGNKKASRIFDSEREAATSLRGGEVIEYRPGESTRCASYCLAAPFCAQWAKDPTNPKNQQENTENV